MKNKLRYAALEARTASLRANSAFASEGVVVNEEQGLISNCAVMTIGPAKGHGFNLDSTSLDQLAALINASPDGVVMRFKHPKINDDGSEPDTLGTDVGRLKNARVVGDAVRGDAFLGDYASALPGFGDVRTYLLKKAKSDPAGFGLSAVIGFDVEPLSDTGGTVEKLVARISQCDAVDFVGRPAANPNGLLSAVTTNQPASIQTTVGNRSIVLSAPTVDDVLRLRSAMDKTNPAAAIQPGKSQLQSKGALTMNPELKTKLHALGLAEGATDEEAQAFLDGLPDDKKSELSAAPAAQPVATAATLAARTQARTKVITDDGDNVLAIESKRVTQLRQLGETLSVDADVVKLAISHGDTVIDAKKRYLKHLSDTCKPVTDVRVGDNKTSQAMLTAIPDALRLRAGIAVEGAHELAKTKLRFMTMIDMYRAHLGAAGVSADELMAIPRNKMTEMILCPPKLQQAYPAAYAQLAQSSSSFANLTLDAMGKTLRQAYVDTPTTWQQWCRRETAPDFKSQKFISLSDAPGLTAKTEGKPIDYSVMSDGKETATLARYASGIVLTAEAVINDDLRAFGRIPMSQGGAAKRLEDDVAYAILTANANLSDSVALFHATHSNLVSVTAGLGAPTVTTVAAAEKLMLLQTGPKGAYLKIQPKFIIVPVALKTIADQLFGSLVDPAKSNAAINPYSGRFTVIADPRLDASSAAVWYLSADPTASNIDTVAMIFLADAPEPTLKAETTFDTEDSRYAVIHNVVAKAIDYRGLVKNPGA